ncbi:hypothetical protein [Shewanella sp. GXUN23E]|uniref:hypothetical protein n=1 Tax=Shewanella sp. GXUN23E TaxID=3422498 RepID=UPI003D7CCD88
MNKLPLAMIIAAIISVPAMAEDGSGSDVTLTKKVNVEKDLKYTGEVTIEGTITADGLGMAVVENKQGSVYNQASNYYHNNSAGISDTAFQNAAGNIGVNVAAGDNNAQANSAALAAIDAEFAFGSGDAEIFSDQLSMSNYTTNHGSTNSAFVGNDSFAGASGNIGVNVASGNNNAQANNLAASVYNGRLGEASVSNNQATGGNMVMNQGVVEDTYAQVQVSLALDATGTYSGDSEMTSQYYPEIWQDPDGIHRSGDETLWGHIDFNQDTESGGLPDADSPDGVADENMTFHEAGELTLAGTVTGNLPMIIQQVKQRSTNTARVSGNAFSGATGNIGVNIASGTGNLQANNLSLTAINGGGGSPGNE